MKIPSAQGHGSGQEYTSEAAVEVSACSDILTLEMKEQKLSWRMPQNEGQLALVSDCI